MPTYTEIAYAEYVETPNLGLSLTPAQFRVSFRLAGYSGSATELEVYAPAPCLISKADSSSDRFTPLHAIKAEFKLRLHSVAHAELFYVTSDRQMQVEVNVDYTGGTTYSDTVFIGWVLPTDLSFDYKKPPFALDLTAVCGIATLKERPLMDAAGKRLSGFVSLSQVIRTALAGTDLALDLETGVNLFELSDVAVGQTSNGKADAARDPLYQTMIRGDALLNEKNETLSCYDALIKVLSVMQCRIAQNGGRWLVLRADETAGGFDVWESSGETIHTRTYSGTAPESTATAHTSRNLNVYAYPGNAVQVLKKSPKVGRRSIRNGVRVEQSFGKYLNKLPNADFSQVDSSLLPIGWTVNNLSAGNRFRAGNGTEADPYRLVINGAGDEKINNDTPYVALKVDYPIQSTEYTRFNKRTLSFDAQLINAHAAKVFVMVIRDDGPYLYVQSGLIALAKIKKKEMVATLFTNVYLDANGHEKAKAGWFKCSLDLGTIDRVKSLTVYLCKGEALNKYDSNGIYIGAELGPPTPQTWYANVRLESEKDGLKLDGTQQTIKRGNKLVDSASLVMTLGDVPGAASPDDRLGTLFRRSTLTPTTAWYRANQAIGPQGQNASLGKTWLSINTEARARQAMQGAAGFEGQLIGRLPFGAHTVLRVSDVGVINQDDLLIATPHQITRWEWDTRGCRHTITGEEMLTGAYTLPARLSEWNTPDGPIPLNENADGLTVSPPDPITPNDRDLLLGQIGRLAPGIFPLPVLRVNVPGHTPIGPDVGIELPVLRVRANDGSILGSVSPGYRQQIDLTNLIL